MDASTVDTTNLRTLDEAKSIVSSLQRETAILRNVVVKSNMGFDILSGKWLDTFVGIRNHIQDLVAKGQIDAGEHTRLDTILNQIVGEISTVRGMSLADIHERLIPPPPPGMTPAAFAASMEADSYHSLLGKIEPENTDPLPEGQDVIDVSGYQNATANEDSSVKSSEVVSDSSTVNGDESKLT